MDSAPASAAQQQRRAIDPVKWGRWLRRATLPFAIVLILLFFATFGSIRVPAGMDTTPRIPPGSLCLVDKRGGRAGVGNDVFVDVPDGGTLLSRVVAVDEQDRLVVANENADSHLPDSDQFGPLPRAAVRGVVLVVFQPDGGAPGEAIRGR